MALWFGCFCLLGQGERYRVDARFGSPAATLATYWEALRTEDVGLVAECFLDPREAVPLPGMLWFLPPSQELALSSIQLVPVDPGRVLATYDVSFRPVGFTDEMEFTAGNELVRVGAEWRIIRTAGEELMPEWAPIPHRVDI